MATSSWGRVSTICAFCQTSNEPLCSANTLDSSNSSIHSPAKSWKVGFSCPPILYSRSMPLAMSSKKASPLTNTLCRPTRVCTSSTWPETNSSSGQLELPTLNNPPTRCSCSRKFTLRTKMCPDFWNTSPVCSPFASTRMILSTCLTGTISLWPKWENPEARAAATSFAVSPATTQNPYLTFSSEMIKTFI